MLKYTDVVTDQYGNAVAGAVITVTPVAGGSAQLYYDYAGTSLITALTSSANGSFYFYVAAGRYNISISAPSIATYTLSDIFIGDVDLTNKLASTTTDQGAALVGFLQSGTGAVARTLQAKAQEKVSVKDFSGVDPTGISASDSGFSAAATAVGANGQVEVPDGTYLINTNITNSCTWLLSAKAIITGTGTLTPIGNYPGCRVVRLSDSSAAWTKGTRLGTMSRWANTEFANVDDNAELVVSSRSGLYAISASARTSDWTTAPPFAMGTVALTANTINDKADVPIHSYCIYSEGVRGAGAGTTIGIEIDTVNHSNIFTPTPYNAIPWGSSVNLWLAAGGGKPLVNPSTIALGISANGTTFQAGIVFSNDSLTGTNGNDSGAGIAIAMAKGHRQVWHSPDGLVVGEIRSTAGNGTVGQAITFTNTGLVLSPPTAQSYTIDATYQHQIYALDANTIVIRNGVSGPYWNIRNVTGVLDINNASGGSSSLSFAGVRKINFANTGDIYPETDSAQPLGGATKRWSMMYANNVTLSPPALVTPVNNGEVNLQLTSNTSLTFKVKGSDGIVRSASLTLA